MMLRTGVALRATARDDSGADSASGVTSKSVIVLAAFEPFPMLETPVSPVGLAGFNPAGLRSESACWDPIRFDISMPANPLALWPSGLNLADVVMHMCESREMRNSCHVCPSHHEI